MVTSGFSVTRVTIPCVVRVMGVYGGDYGLATVWSFEEQMDKVTLWWRLNWTHVLVRRVVDGMLQVAENNVFDV